MKEILETSVDAARRRPTPMTCAQSTNSAPCTVGSPQPRIFIALSSYSTEVFSGSDFCHLGFYAKLLGLCVATVFLAGYVKDAGTERNSGMMEQCTRWRGL